MFRFEKKPPAPADVITPEEGRPKPPEPWIAQADPDGRKAGDALQIHLPLKTALELRWCPATTSAEWRTNNFDTDFAAIGSLYNAPDIPVHYVTWYEACAFCRRLTELVRTSGALPAGYAFRLPTSAEWEYACRAGVYTTFNDGSNLLSDSPRHLGLDRIGWYDGNARVGYRDRFGNKATGNAARLTAGQP